MKTFILMLCLVIVCACSQSEDTPVVLYSEGMTEIQLSYDIKIKMPTPGKKFDSCKHYSHILISKGNETIFQDTTSNEYKFLCNAFYTKARKLNDNRYEILIEEFDGPDIDKTLALYIKNNRYEKAQILPYFAASPEDIDQDGKKECYGIVQTMDAYGNDSCYYNPTLYYEITDDGILFDSVLTKKKIIEMWGGFYGYLQSDRIILPCK